jgi:hypothetical protein
MNTIFSVFAIRAPDRPMGHACGGVPWFGDCMIHDRPASSAKGNARVNKAPAAVPLGGLLQLLTSVVLLSSTWPLTKIALAAGSTPLWFAEGRAVLSGLVASVLLLFVGRFRLSERRTT